MEFPPHKVNAAKISLQESPLLPGLGAENWPNWSTETRDNWEVLLRWERRTLYKQRNTLQKELKKGRLERLESFWLTEGSVNSSFFRKSRTNRRADPDGEAIWSKSKILLTKPSDLRDRYGEYYGDLLKDEEVRKDPPNEAHRSTWMHQPTMESNALKLKCALKGKSIAENAPTLEEVLAVIKKGSPQASGGSDRLQYGALHLLSVKTIKAINGIIGLWWKERQILEKLVTVEICSLHKKGSRFDLFNKRGIGLVSKLVLIMEMVLVKRMTEALDKAGTRSKAQGGATPGVQTMDAVATIINVIVKARRLNRALFVSEFDLYKFFDQIPHRAFVDAHRFFGFDDETIELASLFWKGFKGRARSRYGYSDWFDIGVGNIQGLAGSPFRSCLVIDMFLLWLEREKIGFRFSTDVDEDQKEHDLDFIDMMLYGVAWVDDVWLFAENKEDCKKTAEQYNKFVSYYTMRFVPEKCHIYILNGTLREEDDIYIEDYQGKVGKIPTVAQGEAFRCLGAHFDLKMKWSRQFDEDHTKLRDFATNLGKTWSPPTCTAKLVNTNGAPKITYALSMADYKKDQIRKLQGLLIQPVKKDGKHSKWAKFDAYCVPQQKGGYGVTNVSAVYKASKVAVVHRLLNCSFEFAAITTRMHIIDWQR